MTTTDTPAPKRGRGRPRGSTKRRDAETGAATTAPVAVALPPGRAGLSPDEVANALSISASQVYVLLERGEFTSFHIGRSHRILAESVAQFIERQVAAEGQSA